MGYQRIIPIFIRENLLPSCSILVLKDKPLTDTSRPRNSLNGSSLLSKMRNSFLIITIETPTIASREKKNNENKIETRCHLLHLWKWEKSAHPSKHISQFLPCSCHCEGRTLPSLLVTAAVALALTVWSKHVAAWEPDVGRCHWQARLEVAQCFPLHCLSHTPWAAMRNGTCTRKCSPENRIELRPQTGYVEKFKDTY